MADFFISVIITIFTNIYIIIPFWDKLKEYELSKGTLEADVTTFYNLLCGVSYISVGLLIYALIWGIKKLLKRIS